MKEYLLPEFPLDLATQKLGDLGTRGSRKVGKKTIDLQLQLGRGITRDRLINNDVDRAGIPDVLRADKRIGRNLLKVKAKRASCAFSTIRITHSEFRISVVRGENTTIRQESGPRSGDCNGINGNRLWIGESHETEPMQKSSKWQNAKYLGALST